MSGVIQGMCIVLMILYIVSPIDLCPGPADDLVVLLVGLAAQQGVRRVSNENGGKETVPCGLALERRAIGQSTILPS